MTKKNQHKKHKNKSKPKTEKIDLKSIITIAEMICKEADSLKSQEINVRSTFGGNLPNVFTSSQANEMISEILKEITPRINALKLLKSLYKTPTDQKKLFLKNILNQAEILNISEIQTENVIDILKYYTQTSLTYYKKIVEILSSLPSNLDEETFTYHTGNIAFLLLFFEKENQQQAHKLIDSLSNLLKGPKTNSVKLSNDIGNSLSKKGLFEGAHINSLRSILSEYHDLSRLDDFSGETKVIFDNDDIILKHPDIRKISHPYYIEDLRNTLNEDLQSITECLDEINHQDSVTDLNDIDRKTIQLTINATENTLKILEKHKNDFELIFQNSPDEILNLSTTSKIITKALFLTDNNLALINYVQIIHKIHSNFAEITQPILDPMLQNNIVQTCKNVQMMNVPVNDQLDQNEIDVFLCTQAFAKHLYQIAQKIERNKRILTVIHQHNTPNNSNDLSEVLLQETKEIVENTTNDYILQNRFEYYFDTIEKFCSSGLVKSVFDKINHIMESHLNNSNNTPDVIEADTQTVSNTNTHSKEEVTEEPTVPPVQSEPANMTDDVVLKDHSESEEFDYAEFAAMQKSITELKLKAKKFKKLSTDNHQESVNIDDELKKLYTPQIEKFQKLLTKPSDQQVLLEIYKQGQDRKVTNAELYDFLKLIGAKVKNGSGSRRQFCLTGFVLADCDWLIDAITEKDISIKADKPPKKKGHVKTEKPNTLQLYTTTRFHEAHGDKSDSDPALPYILDIVQALLEKAGCRPEWVLPQTKLNNNQKPIYN